MGSEKERYWKSIILSILNIRQKYETERLLSEEFQEEESAKQLILERLTKRGYEIISSGDGKILAERGHRYSITEHIAYAIMTGRDISLLDDRLVLEIETAFREIKFHFIFPDRMIERHHITELEKEVDLLMPIKPVPSVPFSTGYPESPDVLEKSIISSLLSRAARISKARNIAKNVFWFVLFSTLGLSIPFIV